MSQKIKSIVDRILKENKISSLPIKLEKILNRYNIGLGYSVFEDTLSGLLYKKNDKHIILVNSNHPPVRQRFTIAHELGHYFLDHHSNLFIDKGNLYRNDKSSEGNLRWEKDANKFAAELLMPEELMIDLVEEKKLEDDEDLVELAKELEVSTQALTYRLNNLGLISLF